MEIEKVKGEFSVCKVEDYSQVNLQSEYCFVGKTDAENSLVCLSEQKPSNITECEDGWKALRIKGVIEFDTVGVLSRISSLLAEKGIAIFVVSTFNTDYIFVKKEQDSSAVQALVNAGFRILTGDPYGDYFLNRTLSDIMEEYGEQRDEWKSVNGDDWSV